jgi:AraC-like DNA-binding protein
MKNDSFKWPLHATPHVELAIRVPFSPQNLSRQYLHPTFALHQHGYHARLWIGKKSYLIHPGDVTFSPPNTISRYELKETGYHWCIHFCPVILLKATPTFTLPYHIPMEGEEWGVTERMQSIARILGQRQRKQQAPLRSCAVSTALQELLLRLAIYVSNKQHMPHRYARRSNILLDGTKKILDDRFTQRIEVADLAKSSQLSRNYFSNRFHERFGMTVDTYLLRRRIEMARHLLVTTSLSIKEIAFECGIPDPHYFNKQFRRITGTSPCNYRLENS